jgi:hypothetical protein
MNPRKKDQEPEVTPQRFAETTPKQYSGGDYSFVLQGVFKLQDSVARLEQAVKTLSDEQRELRTKVDSISHKVYAAVIVLILIGGILGYFQNFTNTLLLKLVSGQSQPATQPLPPKSQTP